MKRWLGLGFLFTFVAVSVTACSVGPDVEDGDEADDEAEEVLLDESNPEKIRNVIMKCGPKEKWCATCGGYCGPIDLKCNPYCD